MFKTFLIVVVVIGLGCEEPSDFLIESDSGSDIEGTDTTTEGSVDSDSDSDSDSDTDSEGDADADTDSSTDSDSDSDSDSDTSTDTNTDTDTGTQTDIETETETETNTETNTDTSTVTDTETGSETESDTNTALACDPGETQLCYCVGAGEPEQGVQTCNEAGTGWSECECRPDCPWNSGWPCPCAMVEDPMVVTYCNDGSRCTSLGYEDIHPELRYLGVCVPTCATSDVCVIDDYDAEGVCFGNVCHPKCGDDSDCPPDTICYETNEDIGYLWDVCRPVP